MTDDELESLGRPALLAEARRLRGELEFLRAVLRLRGLEGKVRRIEKPCKVPGCKRTFLVIDGTREARRQFCSNTCRVADWRKRKDELEGRTREPKKVRPKGPFDYTGLGGLT